MQSLGFALTGESNRVAVGPKWVRLLYLEAKLPEDGEVIGQS
jgi:hypothetical protein